VASERLPIRTLQLGLRWFPEFPGGLHRLYYEMVRHLPSSEVAVRGLVTGSSQVAQDSSGIVRAFAEPDAPLSTRCFALRRELRLMLSEQPLDLVAAHFALYTFPVLDMLRSQPLVFHFHGPWALEAQVEGDKALKVRAKAALERAVYRRAVRCIVLSSSFRDVLNRYYGVPMERIRLVPGGVDVERWRTALSQKEARERLGWLHDRPVVFTARRLARRMGLENLVSAISEVRRRVPEILLLIAGRGALSGELEAQIRSLDLQNSVKLLGFLPDEDLPLAYRAADLSVLPTVALEGFGMVAVESLAAGTPILVTPVGGLPEVVSDLSGDLVLPGSGIRDLAEGLEAALKGELALPDTEACQNYARARYDWPVVATRIRNVYTEAVG
jgi:glycosyltransferase involved in cell wall biosynthesis